MEQITRQINWNVSPWMEWLLYTGAFVALASAVGRLWRRVSVWRMGRTAEIQFSLPQAFRNVFRWVAGRGKMNRDHFTAVMHDLILWGFIILFIGTTLVFLEHQTPLHFFYGSFYLVASLIIDLGGFAFLVGLGMAVQRRYIRRQSRLKQSGWVTFMIILMAAIGVTGFLLEAARIAVDLPRFEAFSIIGYGLALALRFTGMEAAGLTQFHETVWLSHALLCIVFFGAATVYFFRHIVVSVLSVALRPERSSGQLRAFDPFLPESEEITARHLTWKDLLDADACTACGRCSSVCPATASGKALDPREIVLKLSDLIDRQSHANGKRRPAVLDTTQDRELWDCTTCGACVYECPVHIEVFDKIIDLRRNRVEIGLLPDGAGACLESLQDRQNPWNYPPMERTVWAESLRLPTLNGSRTPEWVYWIGCAGAFDPSGQSISRSMVEILRKTGVDFAVLGSQERCTGDPARRLGDEALFQEYKRYNLETLRKCGVKRIVTHCPHCLNTFRNEYQAGGSPEFEVVHHSQFLEQLINDGKLRLNRRLEQKVTFHDPCYLGRHNGEYEAPRRVVDSLPGVTRVEMPRNRELSFCCGGGGGQMWLNSAGSQRIENVRLAEARQTGAQLVASACPFCKVMFESASTMASGQEAQLKVKDISELVVEAMAG